MSPQRLPMPAKSVLLVGLSEDEVAALGLPSSVVRLSAATVGEALDAIASHGPDLVITGDGAGEIDSLDFVRDVTHSAGAHHAPVVFLASPGGGLQPFIYENNARGFTVRYLDDAGEAHQRFVPEQGGQRSYAVRALDGARVADEIARVLGSASRGEPAGDPQVLDAHLWEIGFNHDLVVANRGYHVQTEVIGIEPITVANTVVCGGCAIYADERRIAARRDDLGALRAMVADVHAEIVARVDQGEIS